MDLKINKIGWEGVAVGLKFSNALSILRINRCDLKISNLDILVSGIVQNQSLTCIDLSDNKIQDICSTLLTKIMSGQAEWLDQIVWSYGLRGELPENIHE